MSSISMYSTEDESSFSGYFQNSPVEYKIAKTEVMHHQIPLDEAPSLKIVEDDAGSESSCSDTQFSNGSLAENQLPMKAVKFDHENLHLRCQWSACDYETKLLNNFTEHVASHSTPSHLEMYQMDDKSYKCLIACRWGSCPYRVDELHAFQRHMYVHVYHSKLKSLGENSIRRMDEPLLVCQGDPNLSNIIPSQTADFRCGWGECSALFVNIQEYYDHIRYHCLDNPRGKSVDGGITCKWKGCKSSYPNITKLRDHMKSHTQEKLNACPTCGSLFATRTRLIDHCHRQQTETLFSCDLCMKGFASPRLLRDHIRSHVNNYRCSLCDMSCISPSALESHVRYRHMHVALNPCPHCTYSAKSKTDLVRHIRNVHEKTIFQCSVAECGFVSRCSKKLDAHQLKKHRNPLKVKEGNYRCHLCECRYSRGNSLTRHLIGVHNLEWPSGHVRFRYKLQSDGSFILLTVRYESEVVITAKTEEETILP